MMSNKSVEFSNPGCLPVENVTLSVSNAGVVQQIKALAFKYIILQVNKDYDSEDPPNLPETFKGFSEIRRPSNTKAVDKLTFDMLKDLVVHLLDTSMTMRIFIEVYPKSVPIFRKTNFVIRDTVKTDFILQAIYSNLDEPVPELPAPTEKLTNGHIDTTPTQNTPKDAEIPDNFREESLISEVKDILPHLGDGFILKCLQHYGFNAERVINSILEDNLAEPLRALDQSLPIIPEDPLDTKFLETGQARLNVFDGDQFDIMTRDDVDVSKIHIGKRKSKYKDLKDMLDDKTEVKKMVDIYSKYNLICDEEALYSDEYDDTYDSDGVAPVPDLSDDTRRPFEESEEEPEGQEEDKPSSSRNKMDFCVNPEEMRARKEASYQARRGRGHANRPAAQPRNTDVTGKPRGQGQEKEVLHNRDKKEKNKSARANHNRRSGAQWKRSQGMMPS
ncbi:hypothetical protein HF086_007379 [Spodoptera exigua]|uniref:CUE domain-containing protein n=1 Tax=Spodoptera exigua TaxID=7107 RepID=A0A922MHP3_SPOEX|nr:hypothetical protein HF086_007379 [Spodoptera exigua]